MRSVKLILALLATLWAPAALAQSATSLYVVDFTSNTTIGVSAAGHLRLRYNTGTGVLETSTAGGAYAALIPAAETLAATYAAGANTTASIMLLDSTRGPVIIRDNSPTIGGTLFAVQNNTSNAFLTISSNAQNFIRSGAADGASAVSLAVDTISTWSNATSKLLRVLTGNSERFFITGPGTVNMIAATAISGAGSFNLSASSGTFLTTTGAHTFGSPTWGVPANLAITGVGSSTNTTATLFTPNVAAGASSVAFRINNAVALTTGQLLQIGDNGVLRLQMTPLGADGFQFKDATGSAFLNMTSAGTSQLCFSAACYSTGSGGLTMSDAVATWTMASGLLTGPRLNMKAASSAQTQALQAWRASDNNAHYGVDSYGLPSLGAYFEFRETWLWTSTAAGATVNLSAGATNTSINNNNTWSYTSTANATGFTNVSGFATGSAVQSGVTIGSGTTSGNSMFIRSMVPLVALAPTNIEFVAEWMMVTNAVGANSVTYAAGPSNNGVNAAHPGGFYFQKASGDTNWQCMTDSGTVGPTAANSGVPPVASTAQLFRVEYYGSTTPVGGPTAKFYIDGALVCNTTTNVFTGGSLIFSAFNTVTTNTTQKNLSIGPLLLMYNEVAAAGIP